MRRILSLLLLALFLLAVLPSCGNQSDTEMEDIPPASENEPEGGDALLAAAPAPAPGTEEEQIDGGGLTALVGAGQEPIKPAEGMMIEEIEWSVPITVEATGEIRTYTVEDAKNRELVKTYASLMSASHSDGPAPVQISIALEGVLFTDVLEDIGVEDCRSVTVTDGQGKSREYSAEDIETINPIFGWIMNKTTGVTDSEPYYVVFGFSAQYGAEYGMTAPIQSIVIHS